MFLVFLSPGAEMTLKGLECWMNKGPGRRTEMPGSLMKESSMQPLRGEGCRVGG